MKPLQAPASAIATVLTMVFVMVRGRGRVMAGPVGIDRLGLAPAGRRVR